MHVMIPICLFKYEQPGRFLICQGELWRFVSVGIRGTESLMSALFLYGFSGRSGIRKCGQEEGSFCFTADMDACPDAALHFTVPSHANDMVEWDIHVVLVLEILRGE